MPARRSYGRWTGKTEPNPASFNTGQGTLKTSGGPRGTWEKARSVPYPEGNGSTA